MIDKDKNVLLKKKKIANNCKRMISNVNNMDLTSDKASEGIYYALSSLLKLSIIISKVPLIPHVISKFTAKHLDSKVLPKYRVRLMNIYKFRINEINKKIESIKASMEDDNVDNAEYTGELLYLESIRDTLAKDIKKLSVI